MKILQVHQMHPAVRVANFQDVPPGAVFGERTIHDLELILIVRGRFQYTDPQRDVSLRDGHVLLIEPDVPHTLRHLPDGVGPAFSCIHCELLPGKSWARRDYRLDPAPPRCHRRWSRPPATRPIPTLCGGLQRRRQMPERTVLRDHPCHLGSVGRALVRPAWAPDLPTGSTDARLPSGAPDGPGYSPRSGPPVQPDAPAHQLPVQARARDQSHAVCEPAEGPACLVAASEESGERSSRSPRRSGSRMHFTSRGSSSRLPALPQAGPDTRCDQGLPRKCLQAADCRLT